jgi:hypothetical protein
MGPTYEKNISHTAKIDTYGTKGVVTRGATTYTSGRHSVPSQLAHLFSFFVYDTVLLNYMLTPASVTSKGNSTARAARKVVTRKHVREEAKILREIANKMAASRITFQPSPSVEFCRANEQIEANFLT